MAVPKSLWQFGHPASIKLAAPAEKGINKKKLFRGVEQGIGATIKKYIKGAMGFF